MVFNLPELPYSRTALKPSISEETLNFHYGKHHQSYVTKLNALVGESSEFQNASLEELIKNAKGGIFNNAAQVWNHNFYWNSLSPHGGREPKKEVADVLEKNFGSVEKFKEMFSTHAIGHFGSGWAWLVQKSDGKIEVESTSDANNPIQNGNKPLLTCDVWEHAYYIDYRNARPEYIKAFWKIVNWDFITENLQS